MPSDSSLIAVSQRVVEVSSRGEVRDCLDQQWAVWLQSLGFICIPVPNRIEAVAGFLERLAPRGIVLSGGNNLTMPVYDGLAPGTPIGDAYESRDRTERELIEFARSKGLPVLGCCRGMQFLHAYFGGRLAPLANHPVPHVNKDHPVELTHAGFRQLASEPAITVNSFHGYGILSEALPDALEPFAVSAPDGTVEGFHHRELPIIGIMWHPERRNPAATFDTDLASRLFRGWRP